MKERKKEVGREGGREEGRNILYINFIYLCITLKINISIHTVVGRIVDAQRCLHPNLRNLRTF